jgi:hypothetical protein
MSKDNYKILIRNLRTGKNAKLKIQSTASSVKFNKIRKSIQIQPETKSDNS